MDQTGTLVFFDLKTTGPYLHDRPNPRIIELALIAIRESEFRRVLNEREKLPATEPRMVSCLQVQVNPDADVPVVDASSPTGLIYT